MYHYLSAAINVAIAFAIALAIVLVIAIVVIPSPSQENGRLFVLLSEPAQGAFGDGTYVEYAIDGHIYGTIVLNDKYDEFIAYLNSIPRE
jgi:hypothetical protein